MRTLHVVQPGLLTTVQDLGRPGYQALGVSVSGAMDPCALRLANLLVGNEEGDAALEITLVGGTLHFDGPTLLAITGADLRPEVAGAPVPGWRPVWLGEGGTLRFRSARTGCRAYLAVAGGIEVPVVLGSRSTYLRAGIGGVEGRALRSGDRVPLGTPGQLSTRIAGALARGAGPVVVGRTGIGHRVRPRYSDRPVVRLMPGEHAAALSAGSQRQLHGTEFRVSARSDRSGYRLEGSRLALASPLDILSEAVAFGTVQLPPDGAPIVLMADRQSTGGYPRIGEVATVDLPLLAQLRPGDRVAFRPCTLADAQALLLSREHDLARVRAAIELVYRQGAP